METNNAEVQSKKSKIKEILFTDRGGTIKWVSWTK